MRKFGRIKDEDENVERGEEVDAPVLNDETELYDADLDKFIDGINDYLRTYADGGKYVSFESENLPEILKEVNQMLAENGVLDAEWYNANKDTIESELTKSEKYVAESIGALVGREEEVQEQEVADDFYGGSDPIPSSYNSGRLWQSIGEPTIQNLLGSDNVHLTGNIRLGLASQTFDVIATMSASDVISKVDENNKFSLESQDKFNNLDLLNIIFNESEDASESYMYRIVCCDGGEYGNVQSYITGTEQFINDLNDYLKIADASASIESNCIKTSAGELRFATEDEFFQAFGFQSAINLQYRINGYQDVLNAMKTNQKALEKTKKALGVLLNTDLGNLSDFGDMTSGVKAMGDISKSIGNTAKGVSQALKESINNFSLQDFCWSVGVSPNKLSDSEQKQVFATFFAGGKTNTKYTRGMKHIEMYARGLEVIKDAKDKDEIINGFQRILDSAVGSADYEIRLKSLLGLSRKIGKDFTKFVKDNIK